MTHLEVLQATWDRLGQQLEEAQARVNALAHRRMLIGVKIAKAKQEAAVAANTKALEGMLDEVADANSAAVEVAKREFMCPTCGDDEAWCKELKHPDCMKRKGFIAAGKRVAGLDG